MLRQLGMRTGGWQAGAAAVLVVLVIAGLGVLRVWPPFAVVMSGSMAPTINTGDMVVLEHLRGPARLGEVVAVPVPDHVRARYGYPPVVIHRVVRIARGQIRTKGDAWPAVDPFTVPRTAVSARVIADIPAGGRVLAFFHSAPGLLWLLFGGLLFIGRPLLDRLRDARRHETEASAELRGELASLAVEFARLRAEQEGSRQTGAEILAQLARVTQLVERALVDGPPREAAEAPAGVSSVVAADAVVPGTPSLTSTGDNYTVTVADTASLAASPGAGVESAARKGNGDAAYESTAARAIPGSFTVRAPNTAPRSAAARGRWDALPPVDSPSAVGWAAPPGAPRSRRFRRPGRLVAASMARAPTTA